MGLIVCGLIVWRALISLYMANTSLQIVGKTIKKLREKQKVSQEELSFRSGIHRTYMGRVERGKQNLSLLNIIKVAQGLKVHPSVLLKEL